MTKVLNPCSRVPGHAAAAVASCLLVISLTGPTLAFAPIGGRSTSSYATSARGGAQINRLEFAVGGRTSRREGEYQRKCRRAGDIGVSPSSLFLSDRGVLEEVETSPPAAKVQNEEIVLLPATEKIGRIGGTPLENLDLPPALVQSEFIATSSVDLAAVAVGDEQGSPESDIISDEDEAAEYKRGLFTIGFITLIFSSMSPAMHAALSDATNAPPVLLLNAVVSVVALCGLLFAGPLLEASTPLPRSLVQNTERQQQQQQQQQLELDREDSSVDTTTASSSLPALPIEAQAGLELGLWKFLGTTANLYGLSLTTADHGAFLIQLTTLIVPTVQGIMGVPIPTRIKYSIGLALAGVYLFTQDPAAGSCAAASAAEDAIRSSNLALGDALCVVAAGFYATYDLRLFKWGKLVKPRELITGKITTQALLSVSLLLAVGYGEASEFVQHATLANAGTIGLLALWSGLAVNAVAPFLQVGGQQAVGPTRAQTLYASQPLWAAMLSFAFLGETVGPQGLVGGGAFLSALFLAATAEPPEPDCGVQNCEV